MAKIECALERDGRLRVLRVKEFQPGDMILLDEPLEVSWHIGHGSPAISISKCVEVVKAFAGNGRIVEHVIPNPCPPNEAESQKPPSGPS
jgi:hypothetical protein